MDWFLLDILTLLCLVMIAHGLVGPGRFYHYPFFAAAIFLTFVLPQIPGLAGNPFVAEGALAKTLFLSVLCLLMAWLGWNAGARGQGLSPDRFSEARLLRAAAVLSLIGGYFFYKFGQVPDDERLRGQLTGVAVAHLFFAKLLTYGLAIALICYARRHSNLALAIILFDAAFYLERIFIAGRRGETAEFCLMIALAFWFQRRLAVPRLAVLAGLLFSIVGLLGAGEYRQATYYGEQRDWTAVLDIDLARNWDRLIEEGGPEMLNAVNAIAEIDRTQAFNYGLSHWNSLVFSYVPAQLVGESFKNSLLIEVPDVFAMGYQRSVGSTSTGMTDAFASFWYLGSVKFFLIALAMGWLYAGARRGSTAGQLLYILSVIPSMLAISHFTNEVVIAWVHMAIFLGPALVYARVRSREAPRAAAAAPAG
ncbi:MAG: hypothetical protein IH626_16335 [Rhodospirillales bacterium]|nr:hypothetical protein [Rhodospirillales bacterium]